MAIPAAAIIGGAQALGGVIQSIFGGGQAKKAQRQMQSMIDSYKPNAGIMDFYNKALQRYSANPYTSSLYNYQQDQARGATASGMRALGDRRSTLAGLPGLVQGQNDAMLKAAATAEEQQGQALSQLGGATQMKAAEDFKPFEMKYNLLAAKAGGGNQIMNSGLSNIFGGLNNIGSYYTAKAGAPTTKNYYQQ